MRGLPLFVGALAVVSAACGGDDGQASDRPASNVTLEGVGEVPPTLTPDVSADSAVTTETTESPETTDTTVASDPVSSSPTTFSDDGSAGSAPTSTTPDDISVHGVGTIGDVADGNRVLVIGDSLMASTAVRYGGLMCQRLVPLGWAVEVEAETARQVSFGIEVLDELMWEDWDVAVVMLGNNYSNGQVAFEVELALLVERLAPRPTLLFTVTEFETSRVEVNDSIRRVAALHQNVRVADWANLTSHDEGLLSDDDLHLSEVGKARLVNAVVDDLGLAPAGSTGECLPSRFIDDNPNN